MALLYSIAIHLYYLVILCSSLFDKKARLWIIGRKDWRKRLRAWKPYGNPVYWFHAASLGEFEQGRPLIEAVKKHKPGCSIILTFYSPSGFEIRKNYQEADLVCYLPLDTAYNARKFIALAKPASVFLIKYEYWYFYLKHLHGSGIPVYLVSGIFRKNHIFFRWYGQWFRNKLSYIDHFFVQDQPSAVLLNSSGFRNVTVSGDTRFDRVASLGAAARNIDLAGAFVQDGPCLVAGSTWPADEMILVQFINESVNPIKLILAPHEIGKEHIRKLVMMIRKPVALFSEASLNDIAEKQVLIIDNIGMLSSLYRYGQLAYVGGGFGKGIHNILEAATYSVPVVFGPNYQKFHEAKELIACMGAFTVSDYPEFRDKLHYLLRNPEALHNASKQAGHYVISNIGATNRILEHILDNYLPDSN
jgi:3-deoxy-D-manno-octulosonic-acid transferase